MRVLVVVASHHGSTGKIVEALAIRLREHSLEATCTTPDQAVRVEDFDGVVVGSAVYMGKWLGDALEWIDRNAEQLNARPVWLFSSGPLDDAGAQALPDRKVEELVGETGALGHHVFAGRLDRTGLGFGERLVARAVRVPDGDFRDWDDIAQWADQIAEHLQSQGGR